MRIKQVLITKENLGFVLGLITGAVAANIANDLGIIALGMLAAGAGLWAIREFMKDGDQ